MRSYTEPKRLPPRRKWYTRFFDRGSNQRGWLSLGAEKLKEARERLATLRMREAMGPERARALNAEALTLGEAVAHWLSEKKERVSRGRFAIYSYQARYWREFFGESMRLADLTADHVRAFLRRRKTGALSAAKGELARPLSATTINEELAALRNFLNAAVRNEWLAHNPALAVEKYRGEIRRRVRTITVEEEGALLRACREPAKLTVAARRNLGGRTGGKVSSEPRTFEVTSVPPPHLHPIVLVALKSGLRRRTILSLRWRDLDLERGQWNIPGELVKTSEPYTQPMAASVSEALGEWQRTQLERVGPESVRHDAAVFGLGPGSSLKKAFARAVRRAGLEGLTFHDLRRVFLNRLRERGVPLDVAVTLTGHRSLAVVMKHYRETPAAEVNRALEALDGMRPEKDATESGGKE
ncbi:MAG: tyrosine-type recombinase/integrase [Planctomycetes bacterium]|nr:tyrosine-type recombinase/integrase [Planctomycetota bacterium]